MCRTWVVLDNMRKDLTISLDEEYINALLEIAENQKSTLSALIRDIFSSYIQAVTRGDTPDFKDLTNAEGEVAGVLTVSTDLSGTVARHAALIADLERRVGLLEGRTLNSPYQPQKPMFAPDLMALTSPVGISSSAGVIDSDMPPVGNLAEEALVKVQMQPVAPVMDAMEMGSMKIRTDKEYSQTEAAVALGISVTTMRKYIKEKKIAARKVGRSWLIHGRDILAHKAAAQG
ncbi:helix-turn-helix domain-containing protein [Methanospirillum hungatei]|nr:helix-turn-helix domain-containing protein [Methanospirillum hungatei]